MDRLTQILEYKKQGYLCSQIMMLNALELEGKENPDLVRAMTGLNCGLGFTWKTCGALIGGCAVLGYFAGKGSSDETESSDFYPMVAELVNWFEEKNKSCDCGDLLNHDLTKRMETCPRLMAETFDHVTAQLIAKKYIPE